MRLRKCHSRKLTKKTKTRMKVTMRKKRTLLLRESKKMRKRIVSLMKKEIPK